MKQIKKDKFRKARGGTSKVLVLSCSKCKSEVAHYQKDGIGTLLRLYLDRFKAPTELLDSIQNIQSKSEIQNLVCAQCGSLIGIPMVYESENRLAYRLVRGSFMKKAL